MITQACHMRCGTAEGRALSSPNGHPLRQRGGTPARTSPGAGMQAQAAVPSALATHVHRTSPTCPRRHLP